MDVAVEVCVRGAFSAPATLSLFRRHSMLYSRWIIVHAYRACLLTRPCSAPAYLFSAPHTLSLHWVRRKSLLGTSARLDMTLWHVTRDAVSPTPLCLRSSQSIASSSSLFSSSSSSSNGDACHQLLRDSFRFVVLRALRLIEWRRFKMLRLANAAYARNVTKLFVTEIFARTFRRQKH